MSLCTGNFLADTFDVFVKIFRCLKIKIVLRGVNNLKTRAVVSSHLFKIDGPFQVKHYDGQLLMLQIYLYNKIYINTA